MMPAYPRQDYSSLVFISCFDPPPFFLSILPPIFSRVINVSLALQISVFPTSIVVVAQHVSFYTLHNFPIFRWHSLPVLPLLLSSVMGTNSS